MLPAVNAAISNSRLQPSRLPAQGLRGALRGTGATDRQTGRRTCPSAPETTSSVSQKPRLGEHGGFVAHAGRRTRIGHEDRGQHKRQRGARGHGQDRSRADRSRAGDQHANRNASRKSRDPRDNPLHCHELCRLEETRKPQTKTPWEGSQSAKKGGPWLASRRECRETTAMLGAHPRRCVGESLFALKIHEDASPRSIYHAFQRGTDRYTILGAAAGGQSGHMQRGGETEQRRGTSDAGCEIADHGEILLPRGRSAWWPADRVLSIIGARSSKSATAGAGARSSPSRGLVRVKTGLQSQHHALPRWPRCGSRPDDWRRTSSCCRCRRRQGRRPSGRNPQRVAAAA